MAMALRALRLTEGRDDICNRWSVGALEVRTVGDEDVKTLSLCFADLGGALHFAAVPILRSQYPSSLRIRLT